MNGILLKSNWEWSSEERLRVLESFLQVFPLNHLAEALQHGHGLAENVMLSSKRCHEKIYERDLKRLKRLKSLKET